MFLFLLFCSFVFQPSLQGDHRRDMVLQRDLLLYNLMNLEATSYYATVNLEPTCIRYTKTVYYEKEMFYKRTKRAE